MDLDALRLGELVCARVCHDLGGLAGALVGALELAQEGSDEALAVACEAADSLSRRLRLLRTALGPVSDDLGASDIADIASGLGPRVRVDVSGLKPAVLDGQRARLALAMLVLGAEALPRGGVLSLSSDMAGALRVAASGPGQGWPSSVAQHAGTALPEMSHGLMAPLCRLLARVAGLGLAVDEAPPTLCAAQPGTILA